MLQVVRRLRLSAAALILALMPIQVARARVLINEIHYHPDVKTERVEFIELYNSGVESVQMSGWRLADAVSYEIPNGTSIAPGGYVVVAQDPPSMLAKFGVSTLGPWSGLLGNDGDKVTLLNAAGGVEDQVDYQLGFPWPTVGDPPGYSIELVNPAFDNDLGGSWRASVAGNPTTGTVTLIPTQSRWRFLRGWGEASFPTTAWRALDFDDSTWESGPAPIGYDEKGTPLMGTYLSDMRYNYTTVFFRTTFVVANPAEVNSLVLEALYDDGFKLWINEQPVRDGAFNMAAGELPFDATAGPAREDNSYNLFNLDSPQSYLVPGTNIVAIQAANSSIGGSSDFFLDLRLLAQTGPTSHGPTPGARNSVYATNLPPQIRQVEHSPQQPHVGEPVIITAKITDPEGIRNVSLQYQLVAPGNYIEITDAAYADNWTSVAMNDAGIEGDAQAGDSVFTAVLPGGLQQHRWLVRYRITALDNTGLSITVPYADDPQPNFAYFCYDGVPAWQAAVRPGVTPVLSFNTNVMQRLPAIHLLSKRSAVEDSTWFSQYGGDAYLWTGTLVYDGKVYDHIHYRTRGGVWRYSMVKNMWKIAFNQGHELELRDDYGHRYKTRWSKLNLGACIQQGDYGHRGEQGMFESVGFRLFNLAGVETCKTTFLQFRIIDDAVEADPANQYEGDFWGLYLAVEQEGGQFLDEHGLPDGNFYKMDSGVNPYPYGELHNQGAMEVTDKSDLAQFVSGLNSSSSEAWWRANWYIPNGCSYQGIVQAIHHYDIAAGKNYFYFHNPETGLWTVHPWDLDLTWANNMYDAGGQGGEVFKSYAIPKPSINIEYRNRVREIRDLLFNTDQTWKLIDEYAWLLRGSGGGPTFLDADRCQWDYNPKMADPRYSTAPSKAGQGRFYQWPNEPSVSKDFNGCIKLMKDYVVSRSTLLDGLANDATIPAQPTVTYVGPTNYPLNQLSFHGTDYSGANAFAAMKWRLGEISDPSAPGFDPTEPRHYEITATWETPEMTAFNADVKIPSGAVEVGHTYRVRVRMKDNTGRWSHWSAPVQFVAGLPDNATALAANLRLTELMYDPPGGSDFEFVELQNTSPSETLALEGATFTAGVGYTFAPGATLAPGGYLLVVKTTNQLAFRAHYGLSESVPLVGPYSGSLANDGEQLTLKTGAGGLEIFDFQFGKGRGWPTAAKGAGHSLIPLDRALGGQAAGALDYPGNWRASAYIGGSPGQADPPVPPASVLLNEITAHTDYSDPSHPEYDSDDWIELYNTTGTGVSLNGWYLSDDPADPRKWAIPAVTVPARGWITFDEIAGFHTPITNGFGINKAGEQVLLSYLPGGSQDRVVDAIEFKGQENGVSLGRYPDGAAWWFPMLRTRNTVNSAGLTSLVISEIMYHPPDLDTNDNTRDEYVELFNPTAGPITLQDTNGAWRLSGGIGFDFPANTTMAAGGILLVANFDPTDPAALATFRSVYSLTNSAVAILGPYSGKLGNRSDRVAIEKPQYPDLPGDPYSWIIVDEVIYGNQTPWPSTANGSGQSLQRLVLSGSGNDPAGWVAAAPTPGAVGGAPVDRDGDGMPDDWEMQYALNPDDPSDAALDADGDGMTNLEEFLSGTDPRNPASALRFDTVTTSAGTVVLRFTALANRSYTVQYRSYPDLGNWEKLANVSAEQANRTVEISDAAKGGTASRFYRLVTPSLP